MSAATKPLFPRRRSLVVWSMLALLMVFSSYVITLMLAAACLYIPYLVLSNVSFGLQTLVLAACGLIMALTILWSIVPRRNRLQAPGPRLEATEHPRLFAEIRAVACALDEPAPRDVYLTADVNAFVAQWGGFLGFGRRRVMGIGLPLMQVLTLSQFRAVLAHEFGHYYSGDTRLGPLVYSSRATMVRTLRSFANPSAALRAVTRLALAAAVYYAVTHVLIGYWKIYLRATQLVSRKQEYRADELACYTAGSQALIGGLRAINAAAAALPAYWQQEVAPALQHNCLPPVFEGFSRFLAAPEIAKAIEAGLEKELRHPRKDPYDSHPPLRDRIARAQLIPGGPSSEGDLPATCLLDDLPVVGQRLTEFAVLPKIGAPKLTRVTWEEIGRASVLPAWKESVARFSQLFSRVTAESLFEVARDLRTLGRSIPDPQGMLLRPEQRDQRAAGLLGSALGILLADNGWEVRAQPGECYLERGGERFNPFQVIGDIAAGKVSQEEWIERCRNLGIESARFVTGDAAAHAAI